jgi:crossover junction endodeoxyribonuclease RuvC
MRVMGVDPGLTRLGLAIVDSESSRQTVLVHADVIRTSKDLSIGQRLLELETGLAEVAARFRPDQWAVEQVFSQHNVRTVIGTAQAAGIAALVAARLGIPLTFHTPSEVKAAVTGSGRADKAQVALMVERILRRPVDGPADLTDAVALAICHSWRAPAQQRMEMVRAEVRAGAAK